MEIYSLRSNWQGDFSLNDDYLITDKKPISVPEMTLCHQASSHRADSRFAPSQWETALLCNDISYWLGASLESALSHYLNCCWPTSMISYDVTGPQWVKGNLGPISWLIFHSNSTLEISFCFHPSCGEVIALKFCTWHDSAVMARAKFYSDMIHYNKITLKPIFPRIWITMEKSFVKWAPGIWYRAGKCWLNKYAPFLGRVSVIIFSFILLAFSGHIFLVGLKLC